MTNWPEPKKESKVAISRQFLLQCFILLRWEIRYTIYRMLWECFCESHWVQHVVCADLQQLNWTIYFEMQNLRDNPSRNCARNTPPINEKPHNNSCNERLNALIYLVKCNNRNTESTFCRNTVMIQQVGTIGSLDGETRQNACNHTKRALLICQLNSDLRLKPWAVKQDNKV